MLAFAAACLGATAALGQAQPGWAEFGPGVEVRLPPNYWGKLNADNRTLAVLADEHEAVQFTLALKSAGGASRKSGEAAVRELAKKMDLKVFESGGKLVLMEPRTQGTLDGRPSRNMRIHIGFDRWVVVMNLYVYEDQKDAPAVRQFFETDMDEVIRSIRKKRT